MRTLSTGGMRVTVYGKGILSQSAEVAPVREFRSCLGGARLGRSLRLGPDSPGWSCTRVTDRYAAYLLHMAEYVMKSAS